MLETVITAYNETIFDADQKRALQVVHDAEAAEFAGRHTGQPVRWMDVGLEHLGTVLREAMARKLAGPEKGLADG